jgi:hypothetical protein
LILADVWTFFYYFQKNEGLVLLLQMEGPQFCCLLPIRIIQVSSEVHFVYHGTRVSSFY